MGDQMEDMDSYHLQTAFFPGSAGSRDLSLRLARAEGPSRQRLHVPALADVMHESGVVVARAAGAVAPSGVAVIVRDLFGRGVGEGEVVDVTCAVSLEEQERL